MKSGSHSTLQRFVAACAIALPLTIALFLLMTRLILPLGDDTVVEQLIHPLDLGLITPDTPEQTRRVFARPPKPILSTLPNMAVEANANSTANDEVDSTANVEDYDWRAHAKAIIAESDDELLKEWLLSQGFDKWVSIMQGPMPKFANAITAPTRKDTSDSVYRNTYGDLERPISENCVSIRKSTLLTSSDFDRNLPARIVCTRPGNQVDLSSLRINQEKRQESHDGFSAP